MDLPSVDTGVEHVHGEGALLLRRPRARLVLHVRQLDRVDGGGCMVEGGGWRVEGGGWRVEGLRCRVAALRVQLQRLRSPL